jgi:hypothetical protein
MKKKLPIAMHGKYSLASFCLIGRSVFFVVDDSHK